MKTIFKILLKNRKCHLLKTHYLFTYFFTNNSSEKLTFSHKNIFIKNIFMRIFKKFACIICKK